MVLFLEDDFVAKLVSDPLDVLRHCELINVTVEHCCGDIVVLDRDVRGISLAIDFLVLFRAIVIEDVLVRDDDLLIVDKVTPSRT